jgi:predicted DNA-binding protein (UPF0278 family)
MRSDGMSGETKLFELRRKTDRGLVFLVRKEIDRGLRLAETAVPPKSKLYAQAERAYLMSESWLRLISDLDRDECRELGLRLKELKTLLERRRTQEMEQRFAGASAG